MSEHTKNNHTKRYLLNTLAFIALVIIADRITGFGLKQLYKKQKAGWDYRTRYSAEDSKADVLIFGASRAQQQYNPQFIEDSLHFTCYNVGRDGMPFFYHYAILQAVLKRYTPKVIILDCEYSALKKTETSYERISCLLPLYQDHPEIRPILNLRSPFEKYKFVSAVYPYNSLAFKMLMANLKEDDENIKGYEPLKHSLNVPANFNDFTAPYEIDSVKVNMLNAFIDDCSSRKIKLLFVCSPYYIKSIGTDYSKTITKQIAAAKNIEFLDYSEHPAFINSPQLFDDTVHVNKNGSDIFSAMIASELKKRVSQ